MPWGSTRFLGRPSRGVIATTLIILLVFGVVMVLGLTWWTALTLWHILAILVPLLFVVAAVRSLVEFFARKIRQARARRSTEFAFERLP